MSIRQLEIEIDPGNPFSNCKLDRQKYADVLTDIVDSYSDGFVLAINNKWGTGKTTFIKMWQQDLINKKYQTVYFNAWENDFENNPLTALMGELGTLTKKSTEPEFKKALKNASVLTKHIAPIIAQAIADKYVDTDGIKKAIVEVTKGLTGIFEQDVNEYAKKKKSLLEFRKSLSKFIADTNDGKPLIFIIDELDRCRPNYAVSILEQIKHFFSVSCIVFVLSIDKAQLGHAIRGVYGSDKIDADEYLRRFIDIEYSIPEPNEDSYLKYLYDHFIYDEFFEAEERLQHSSLSHDKIDFLNTCKLLFKNAAIPLRQQEKIFLLGRITLRSFNYNNYVLAHLFFFLVFIKIAHNEFYESLKNKKLTIQDVLERFSIVVGHNLNMDTEKEMVYLELYLLHFYNIYREGPDKWEKLYKVDHSNNTKTLLFEPIIGKGDKKNYLWVFEHIERSHWSSSLHLGFLIKKIDLLDTLKV